MTNLFDVQIIAPQAKTFYRKGQEYVLLPYNSQYGVKITNGSFETIQVTIYLDQLLKHTYNISAQKSITIDLFATISNKGLLVVHFKSDSYSDVLTINLLISQEPSYIPLAVRVSSLERLD